MISYSLQSKMMFRLILVILTFSVGIDYFNENSIFPAIGFLSAMILCVPALVFGALAIHKGELD